MKRYIDGYVLTVPKKNMKRYKRLAQDAAKIFLEHGALQVVESVGEDLQSAKKWGCLTFPKMTKAKPSEAVLFSYIVYKSRAHRDRVNARVMKDPRMSDPAYKDMPFDMTRMAVGGFETIVNARGGGQAP